MGMVIRTNAMALGANNSLTKANNTVNGSLQKLASGFRINKAADDASGLSISEKMKAQIKALDTAVDNCEDGANLIQTAEGYMAETHDMLNRMVEISEKSANGVLDDTDRDALQNEMDQLCGEIDRIATTANFNGKKLLDGSLGSTDALSITSNVGKPVEYSYESKTENGIKLQIGESSTTADKMDVSINSFHTDALLGAVNGFVNKSNDTTDVAATATGATRANYSEEDAGKVALATAAKTKLDTAKTTYDTKKTAFEVTDQKTGTDVNSYTYKDVLKAAGLAADTVTALAGDADATQLTGINALTGATTAYAGGTGKTLINAAIAANKEMIDANTDVATKQTDYNTKAADAQTGYSTYKDAISVDITDKDKASAAADALRQVTNYVSDQRGILGAQQNRLEHTVNNLTTAAENTTAANSRIRDTDMAKEMIKYTQTNVVTQAAQAMLAQANTQPQSVLQLLQ